ncbi:MAG: VWA domain-containing protein [Vicinamibacterales bacterium]
MTRAPLLNIVMVPTLASVAAGLFATMAIAQQPSAAGRTRFKAEAEVVAVDVNVLDREGRPIDNLAANDFSVLVDGAPRRISSAEFVRLAPAAHATAASPYYSSNLDAANGRLVMLVIDQGNISPGRVRGAAESATRFIKRLSPMDRVALFAIPGPGPQINFTANHSLIQAQLPRIAGQALATPGLQRVGVGEALRIDRGDQTALNTTADRECAGTDRQVCVQELTAEAREVVSEARLRSKNALAGLRVLMERLSASQTPKTIVYLSEALVIDQDRSALAWLGPLAAKGRVTLHVLRIDAGAADASAPRRSTTRGEDVGAAEEGLALLAGLTRGSLYRVVGNADDIFERLTRELSGHYLLGFAPEPGDRDGKPHKIKIDIPDRRNIEVRARQEFSVLPPRPHSNEEVVAEALRSPGLLTDIPLRVTAYTFPDRDGDGLRILIAAEIQRQEGATGEVAAGYALMGPNGDVVASQFERQVKTPIREDRTQSFVTAASARTAGVYGLKLAVADDSGNTGSVEHAFKAQLTGAGPARLGDLLIGESPGSAESTAAPTVSGEFVDAESLHGYLELRADSPGVWNDLKVAFEVAAREDSRALDGTAARFDEGVSSTSRRAAEGIVPIGLLPPGEYYARAIVTIGGKTTARLVRPFRIVRSSTAGAGGAGRGRPGARRAAPFSVRIDPFQRASVLAPHVVTAFVDRMGADGRAPIPPEVAKLSQSGQLEAAASVAKSAGHALAATFLEGLTLYAKGDFETAATRFREAIRADSEFFPAIFYLGACYAANGRDRDAAAAWQTSLVSESGTPLVYVVLGDALLRQREIEQAVELLKEASGRWPDDPDVQPRLGTALAMAGKSDEALAVFDRYLDRHREDTERLFLALRLIYEGRANGRSTRTLEEDRARFEAYAAAYAAAGGLQRDLVDRWRDFLKTREF